LSLDVANHVCTSGSKHNSSPFLGLSALSALSG